MKDKIVYVLVFGGAFIGVTFGIMLMNTMFVNIFKFDFRSVSDVVPPKAKTTQTAPLQNNGDNQTQIIHKDSLQSYPGYVGGGDNYIEVRMDSTIYDTLSAIRKKIASLEKENAKVVPPPKVVDTVKTKVDPKLAAKNLEEWAKKTAKLYESMDPKKAAKIIQNYSDNESREIIFKMNKKQAAKILAELNPEQVQRITKAL